ncbi:MAG: SDR family oxidoreductase [Rhodospirillales bacterium]|nr:SDR family oxidoreductase [Rhodospirillales bacterium]
MNSYNFKGRNAIITGGARGIGFATAERFLDCGAAVSLWDFDHEALDEAATSLAAKGNVQAILCDCGDENAVAEAYAKTTSQFPQVDILVANAGVVGIQKRALEFTLDDWNHLLRNDLLSVFLSCRAVVPAMVKRGYGRVVVVTSVVGLLGAPGNAAYATAKGAAITYVKTLGRELANTGVLVNGVAPNAIETPFLSDLTDTYLDAVIAQTPMGRLGQADEVAAQISWLSSEDNSFSTGAIFDLSGGRSPY